MIIGINASFARKASTGIGQTTVNFLKELTRHKTSHKFVLYLEDDLPKDIKLPKNFSKQIFLPLWQRDDLIRKIWWEKYLLPRRVKKNKCDIFISLYQCPTIFKNSPFGKGRDGEGFLKSTENAKIPPKITHSQFSTFTKGEMKHIMIAHDIIPKFYPNYLNNSRKKLYWNLTEKALAKADKILAVSSRTEKDLIQQLGIPAEKISVNYIDVDEIYKKPVETRFNASILKKYKLKPGYIYNGGGLEVRKNAEGVIRAYNYLFEKNKKLHFIREMPQLVVSGKLLLQLKPLVTDAEKLVKELNLTKQVKLLDFVRQEDLPAIYKNALMFVYPSHYEGFGLPVLEAMSQGVPTITAKTSSLPEVGGDSVLYCNPDDIHDIAMVIKNVLLNKNLRETLSRRGQERSKIFSWNSFAGKVLNIVVELK